MTLAEAIPMLRQLKGTRIRSLKEQFPEPMVVNKGNFGSTLEAVLGLNPFSRSRDFVDGELKTNKTLPSGQPKETIAVCVISTLVSDGLFGPVHVHYQGSYLSTKLSNMLIVQVVKEGPEDDWYIHDLYHMHAGPGTALNEIFASDYRSIWELVRKSLAGDSNAVLHTTNGVFLQIRPKDGKPYHRIHCPHHGRVISEKNFAFYLQTSFMRAVIAGEFDEVRKVS